MIREWLYGPTQRHAEKVAGPGTPDSQRIWLKVLALRWG
jgi:hypothetical protein